MNKQKLSPRYLDDLNEAIRMADDIEALAKDCEECGLPFQERRRITLEQRDIAKALKFKFFPDAP
jgi:hypothetical protein